MDDPVQIIIKIDVSGNEVWKQIINYTGDFQGLNTMVAAPGGGYLLGGWAFGFWLSKIDENGQRIWDRNFEGGSEIKAMLVTTDGSYLLGGSSSTSVKDYYVLKVKEENRASGSWDMRYGGSGTDNLLLPPSNHWLPDSLGFYPHCYPRKNYRLRCNSLGR